MLEFPQKEIDEKLKNIVTYKKQQEVCKTINKWYGKSVIMAFEATVEQNIHLETIELGEILENWNNYIRKQGTNE